MVVAVVPVAAYYNILYMLAWCDIDSDCECSLDARGGDEKRKKGRIYHYVATGQTYICDDTEGRHKVIKRR